MMPLEGLLAVEIGEAASGRMAGRVLADYGATVLRLAAPPDAEPTHLGHAGLQRAESLFLDAGKQVVEVTPGTAEERALLGAALDRAEVVIESLPPGDLGRRAGVDIGAALAARPGLTVVSVTPYGQDGPRAGRRATDLTLQAGGGFLALSGSPRREPVKAALDQVHLIGGRVAAFTLLASLAGGRGDRGRHIDVSLLEVAVSLPPFHVQQYTHTGAIPGRGPEHEPALDGQHVPAADGYITFATGNTPPEMFSALFDEPALLEERFHTPLGRAEHREELEALIHRAAARWPKQALFERAMELGIVAGTVQEIGDLLACPQLATRDAMPAVATPDGAVRVPRLGFASPGLQARPLVAPAPLDTVEALARIEAQEASPGREAPASGAPLEGVTVLAFEDVIALPWATVQMARLGATVVRVESRARLQGRHWGVYPGNQPSEDWWNDGANLCSLYRGKQSLAVDLADPRAREAVRALITQADVVLDNFRPGVMARLGFGADEVLALNPRAVVLSSSGYGSSGPYASMGAFARTVDAMCGLTDLTGYVDGPPQRANPSYMDMVSAWNIGIATMLGLIARGRTGAGLAIEHSMYEAGVSSVGPAVVEAQLGGLTSRRAGNGDPRFAPQGVYACAGGAFLALAATTEAEWDALARAAGCGWATDPRFAAAAGRLEHREDLDRLIAAWTSEGEAAALEAALQAAGVPASVVRDAREVLQDEQLRARRAFDWIRTPSRDPVYVRPYPITPFRLSGLPPAGDLAPPRLGEHNREWLARAGLSVAEIDALEADGVTGTEPVPGVADPPRPVNLALMTQRGAFLGWDEGYDLAVAGLAQKTAGAKEAGR